MNPEIRANIVVIGATAAGLIGMWALNLVLDYHEPFSFTQIAVSGIFGIICGISCLVLGETLDSLEIIRTTIANYTGKDFIDNFETICNEFQKRLDILTFGIIIYDESTPEFRKILRDNDYWGCT